MAHPSLGQAHTKYLTRAVAFDVIDHDGGENGQAALDRDEDILQVLRCHVRSPLVFRAM
jgi:hypothetical protein